MAKKRSKRKVSVGLLQLTIKFGEQPGTAKFSYSVRADPESSTPPATAKFSTTRKQRKLLDELLATILSDYQQGQPEITVSGTRIVPG